MAHWRRGARQASSTHMERSRTHKLEFLLVIVAAASVVLAVGAPGKAGPVEAAPALNAEVTPGNNSTCLACHQQPGVAFVLPSGEAVPATIDPERWQASEHGQHDMACIQCHDTITGVPHDQASGFDRRAFVIDQSEVCVGCHADEGSGMADSVHTAARASGNRDAATCSDCHDPHYATNPPVSHTEIPATCRECHLGIYEFYSDSVHGSALTEGNPDVPTCTDCHGVHGIQGPDNSPFRLFSPTICASCHADADLMDKYGVSTNVFDTYISDFHGTTVLLFEKIAPDQETNKPVCIDCHGVHDIIATDNPRSTVYQENLLRTCQRCHPDAEADFPASWLGHYQPEPDKAPLVYYVKLFYKILIPLVIGAMALFVLIDIYGTLRRRRRHV